MFTQTRTNLKIIGVILFTMLFFVGGFFIKTTKVEAVDGVQSFNVSYSLSPVTSTPNNDGGITTMVFIGCAPGSGDIYDINTGKPCIIITTNVLIGCAVGSPDLYDINTGKQCTNKTIRVPIGCAVGSGDLFDINTGNRCINNTVPIITGCALGSGDIYDITTGKRCLVSTAPIVSVNNVPKSIPPKTVVITKAVPIALAPIEPINNTNNTGNQVPVRENIGNSLRASVAKAGSIFTGPMSIPLILLIIIILLSGGYAVYSLLKKDKKVEVKKVISEPIIQHKPITPVTEATPQMPRMNTSQNTNPVQEQLLKK